MKKQLAILLTLSLGFSLMASPAFADDKAKIKLKTKTTAAIVEGDTAWVAISWKGDKADASDFRITATASIPGVTIEYPTNTGSYSSLMDDAILSEDEIDFTSLRISVPYGASDFELDIEATWESDGDEKDKDYTVDVPVVAFTGDDLAQVTTDAGSVSAATPSWIGVQWTGLAPTLDDFQMTVTGPAGIEIVYPSDSSYTSLHYDSILEEGETDIARFRVDASGIATGTHTLDVSVTYTKGGSPASVTGTVTMDVTP